MRRRDLSILVAPFHLSVKLWELSMRGNARCPLIIDMLNFNDSASYFFPASICTIFMDQRENI